MTKINELHRRWSKDTDYKDAYDALGETPPPNAKPTVFSQQFKDWLDAKTPRELQIIQNRCGSPFTIR